jgi:outer membrane receptor for ferrienterochelin and colicins
MTSPAPARSAWLFACAALLAGGARAQSGEPAPPPASASASPAPTAAPSQRIEITGGRGSDTDQRRQSTAAKIVIGREEIERYGDSNTLELLKRLPGVTVPGAPGRGGNPRMRGMGGGFTQILVDGERIAPGFSLDSIPPEQIERIEILRAPTAETGARAIAGTINVVLREGFRKKQNDVNLDVSREGGRTSGSVGWTRNDALGDWIVNTSLNVGRRVAVNETRSVRETTDAASGALVESIESTSSSATERTGVVASARLQWRGDDGRSLLVSPFLIDSKPSTETALSQLLRSGTEPLPYDRAQSDNDGRFSLKRLNANFNHRLGTDGPRLEWRAGISEGHWRGDTRRREFDNGSVLLREIDEATDSRDRSVSGSAKASQLVGDGHQLVAGAELERNTRSDFKATLIDGVPEDTGFGENLDSRAERWAVYGQDEWTVSPQWSLHAGLRIEGIATRGAGVDGSSPENRSRVTTPLLHAAWKPSAQSNDRVRASLTRSYRAPNTGQLIGRPSVNRTDPAPGANTDLTVDSAGNPALKPEVAFGLDLAFERYLADGGVLSANLFHRRIDDLIRNVIALEDVSWSPGQPRFVSRPQNIGRATTQGLELEAKFRLDQLIDDAPRTDVRANASIFRSRVQAVPGPDNRLVEQPGGTLNLGLDHRFRGTPLTVGASLNHTPGYRTQLEADRAIVQSEKNVLDAYAAWAFSPEARLRFTLSNALAPDTQALTVVQSASVVESSRVTTRSYVNAQLRLELKL